MFHVRQTTLYNYPNVKYLHPASVATPALSWWGMIVYPYIPSPPVTKFTPVPFTVHVVIGNTPCYPCY